MMVRSIVSSIVTSVLLCCIAGSCLAEGVRLTGSGASFPYPIYSTWFKAFSRSHADVIIDYQPKGSGAGIRDFINRTVDFAGSDAAMTDAETQRVPGTVMLLPMTAGAIVIAYNLPTLPERLRLGRDVYPRIFLGEITRWNDPAIAADNPDVTLPDLPITVVRRADSSGTTYAFTNHLSAISERWRTGPGVGKTVVWPDSDKFVAAPKNDGVTATIKQTPGAIGYIEFGYARFAGVATAALENAAGNYVIADVKSGRAALAGVSVPENMQLWIPDPEGADAYPIVTFSWLLTHQHVDDAAKARALKGLIEYCLTDGQHIADRLGYIPLPNQVVDRIRGAAEGIR